MNKLTKIGLSALAGSLVAVSAHAGSMSVSGSASISISDGDVDNTQAETAEGCGRLESTLEHTRSN